MKTEMSEIQRYEQAKKRVEKIKGFYTHLVVYIIINIFIIFKHSYSDNEFHNLGEWGTYSTAIFWGIGLLFHGLKVFGVDFLLGKNWEDRKISEMMEKERFNN